MGRLLPLVTGRNRPIVACREGLISTHSYPSHEVENSEK